MDLLLSAVYPKVSIPTLSSLSLSASMCLLREKLVLILLSGDIPPDQGPVLWSST